MNETQETASSSPATGFRALVGPSPPWTAKTVWIAAALTMVGAVLWVTDPGQTPTESSGSADAGMNTLADSTSAPGQGAPAKPTSPATFRLGVSYLGGFFLGWAFRRFVKAALLFTGASVLLIGLARKLGWIDLDWASVEAQVHNSLAWLQGEAGTIKQFLAGYLPSAAAAAAGACLGFLRK